MSKEKKMIGYKGFDKDLRCRGFQYEVGKSYTEDTASLCDKGFHFCENPLDIFGYYEPALSRFAEVEADEVSNETDSDSKRVAKKLKIKAELSLHSLCQLGVKFIMDKIDFNKSKKSNTGYFSAATNTGHHSAATNTGNQSAASVYGKQSVAISVGIEGKAKGSLGCFIILAEWKQNKVGEWNRISVKTTKVDGKKIEADTFYQLKNGKFVKSND